MTAAELSERLGYEQEKERHLDKLVAVALFVIGTGYGLFLHWSLVRFVRPALSADEAAVIRGGYQECTDLRVTPGTVRNALPIPKEI